MPEFERAEVEEAFRHFVAVGDSGDWDAWTDLHTEDGLWVEHHLGTQRGRDAIRRTIHAVMKPVPMMEFPVEWHMIEGHRVVAYIWQVFPDPRGGDAVYRFGNVTVLEYAGDGLWSYQEDLYNPREAEQVVAAWVAAGGKLAAPLEGPA
jgi:ketosteroid isomerase-like protein